MSLFQRPRTIRFDIPFRFVSFRVVSRRGRFISSFFLCLDLSRAGDAGPAGEVREQDPDAYQDRSQLQDALKVPARRLLHAQGTH